MKTEVRVSLKRIATSFGNTQEDKLEAARTLAIIDVADAIRELARSVRP